MMNIYNFWGDLTGLSAYTQALLPTVTAERKPPPNMNSLLSAMPTVKPDKHEMFMMNITKRLT